MNLSSRPVDARTLRTHLTALLSSAELLMHPAAAHSHAERNELLCVIVNAVEHMRDMLDASALAPRGH